MIKALSVFLKRTKVTAERDDVPFHKDTFLTLNSAELSHDPINALKIYRDRKCACGGHKVVSDHKSQ